MPLDAEAVEASLDYVFGKNPRPPKAAPKSSRSMRAWPAPQKLKDKRSV